MSTEATDLVQLTRVTDEQELLALERKYCSWGDTVHYLDPPKFFDRCEGNYLYDREGARYLDLSRRQRDPECRLHQGERVPA